MKLWKKILCPVDFSDVSQNAREYGVSLAKECGAELIFIHVVEPIVAPADFSFGPVTTVEVEEQLIQRGRESLSAIADRAGLPSDRATTRVERGRPSAEIVRVAGEEGVDLIVMGTHGYTGLTHALLGSTAERVVNKAPCPVLTIRSRSPEDSD